MACPSRLVCNEHGQESVQATVTVRRIGMSSRERSRMLARLRALDRQIQRRLRALVYIDRFDSALGNQPAIAQASA